MGSVELEVKDEEGALTLNNCGTREKWCVELEVEGEGVAAVVSVLDSVLLKRQGKSCV